MSRCRSFRPAWWLPGAHLQTLYPSLLRQRATPPLTRERLSLPDGDFLDLEWTPDSGGQLVLLLHGLEGSLESHYTGNMLDALSRAGHTAVMMYFRGCSGEPNRLPRSYHSGETGDLAFVVQQLRTRFPERPLAVIGFSLGGNVLLKWLGEKGNSANIDRAVAISVPFELDAAARKLEHGLSRIYQHHLVNKLKQSVRRKAALHTPPIPLSELDTLKTFRQFDNAITAPLHGFRDVDDYYARSSSRQFLPGIVCPTLIIHSADDPFLPPAAIPTAGELGPGATLEVTRAGGHVGFVSGPNPLRPYFWLESRCLDYLDAAC